MDIAQILTSKYPDTEWSLDGDSYSGLTWLSDGDAPTLEELEGHWVQVQFEVAYAKVEEQRRHAYTVGSDPIFFEWQRGDATEQDWLDEVAGIKTAFPYPVLEDFAPEPEPEPEVVEPAPEEV